MKTKNEDQDLATSLRCRPVNETLELIKAELKSIQVEEIVNHTLEGIQSIPVYEAIRQTKHQSDYFCLGKGFSKQQSQASCLMEAAEMRFIEDQVIQATKTLGELNDQDLIYRRSWPEPRPKSQWDSNSIESSVIPSQDLKNGATIYLLEEDIFYNHAKQKTLYGPTTNGLASGNTRKEAILHGLCELLERDAVHRWGLRRVIVGDKAKTSTFQGSISSSLQDSLEEINKAGFHIYITRLPTPHACYVYECGLMRGVGGDGATVLQGWGAHPIEEIAINRAVAEAVQILAIQRSIQNNQIPEHRLPGSNTARQNLTRQLGNDKTFFRNMDRDFSKLTPQLWSLWYGDEYAWPSIKQKDDGQDRIQQVLSDKIDFCTSVNIAPEKFPFFAQVTICSNISAPPGF